jgi:expansin (peptidoglycan-binding protein)
MHATPQSRFRQPWLIVTLAAIGVIALAVGVVHFAPASCGKVSSRGVNANLPPATLERVASGPAAGLALYYDLGQAEDRCSIEPLARDGLYASLPAAQYRGGTVCGAYLNITGPLGTIQAEIVDMCPGCAASQLDLSPAAFTRIQAMARGTAKISYQLARDPALPGPLGVRVGPGSNAGSLAVQVLNHGNPLSGIQVNGRPLTPRGDGYWIAARGAGTGPFNVLVTDTDGNSAVLTGITLRPGAVQQTGVLMYGQPPSPTPVPSPGPVPQRASVGANPTPPPAASTSAAPITTGTCKAV